MYKHACINVTCLSSIDAYMYKCNSCITHICMCYFYKCEIYTILNRSSVTDSIFVNLPTFKIYLETSKSILAEFSSSFADMCKVAKKKKEKKNCLMLLFLAEVKQRPSFFELSYCKLSFLWSIQC